MRIGITGVTGKLGGGLAQTLAEGKYDLVLLARSPERAPKIEGAQVRKMTYADNEEVVSSLEGIDVLLMVSAKENADRLSEHRAFVDAAKVAGVQHIVYTSFYNNAADATFTLGRDHYWTEQHIKELGFKYTFIRDNFYLDFLVDMAREAGEIRGPAGAGVVSAVVRSDVAAVLAAILKSPEDFENRILDMTGPRDYSLAEVCEVCSKSWNKDVVYVDETLEEAYESRKKWNPQDWEMESWVSTYTAIEKGEQAGVSRDIEEVLGRPATSLEEFLAVK